MNRNCFTHRDAPTPPRGCKTCHRIGMEVDIVTRTVDVLLAAGYSLNTDDGEANRPMIPTQDRTLILSELMEVDDERLEVYDEVSLLHPFGWVRFVYGNDGWDVISDYTLNLEDVLTPVNQYVESIAP